VGGTFVDVVLVAEDGTVTFEKVLAEPSDLVGAILCGIQSALEVSAVSATDVREIVHATTRGSNTVLERTGPVTALVTTRGFRDVLQIQRALRWSMYDVQLEKPKPLVPRSLSFEVSERTLADGSVATPLDEQEIRKVARLLGELGVEAVAIAFLHSYARPSHERRARELLLEELPRGFVVSLSSEVSRQAREYERANTAVVNAYITNSVADYLSDLAAVLPNVGVEAPIWVMQSSGGLASVAQATELPVRTLESGPAAGVLAAAHVGRLAGFEDVISFDMGGTTAKAAVVSGGVPATTTYFELGRVQNRRGSGLPVDIPALDLVEIGTGGGSIAEVRHGVLRVGPRSAAADPGPACYARGGTNPTVTDANLVLGYYDPDRFAGGAFQLDVEAANTAIDALAAELGVDRTRAAWGVHEVATLNMEHAIRLVSIDRGFDPREHALVCIGGAGPAHGSRLARALGAPIALVPPSASGGSALGLLQTAESVEYARSALVRLDEEDAGKRCEEIVRELKAEASRGTWAAADGVIHQLFVGMRYVGQGYELMVPLPSEGLDVGELARSFHRRYELAYGYSEDDEPVEAVTWYLALRRMAEVLPHRSPRRPDTSRSWPARRPAYFPEAGEIAVEVHDRAMLRSGAALAGPCLVSEPTTTTVVNPGDTVEVSDDGSLVIRLEQAS